MALWCVYKQSLIVGPPVSVPCGRGYRHFVDKKYLIEESIFQEKDEVLREFYLPFLVGFRISELRLNVMHTCVNEMHPEGLFVDKLVLDFREIDLQLPCCVRGSVYPIPLRVIFVDETANLLFILFGDKWVPTTSGFVGDIPVNNPTVYLVIDCGFFHVNYLCNSLDVLTPAYCV